MGREGLGEKSVQLISPQITVGSELNLQTLIGGPKIAENALIRFFFALFTLRVTLSFQGLSTCF